MKNINKNLTVSVFLAILSLLMVSPVSAQLSDDSRCSNQGGICQVNTGPSSCSGGSYLSGLCSGAANRQCCVAGTAGSSRGSAVSGSQNTGGSQIISLPNPLGSTKTIPELIGKIVDWLIFIASVAVLPFMIIWGAYQFLMAGGNPDKVTEGRHTITWAVVGYGLLLISKGIELIIRDILTRSS